MGENSDKTGDREQPFQFSGLSGEGASQDKTNIDFILDIPLQITVELGRKRMLISDLLKLGQGSVVELTKTAGEPLDVLANDRLIARGEVVVVEEKYGIRLTEIVTAAERVEKMR